VPQPGTELGLADPVFDVGAAPEPGFDVADRLTFVGSPLSGSSWVGMLVTMNDTA
jgi:hypothetical protein